VPISLVPDRSEQVKQVILGGTYPFPAPALSFVYYCPVIFVPFKTTGRPHLHNRVASFYWPEDLACPTTVGILPRGLGLAGESEVRARNVQKKKLHAAALRNTALTTAEAAKLTGYDRDHIGHMIRGGKVKAVKRGRDWFLNTKSLLRYLETNPRPGRKRNN
jgi:excisionase family DNA binding protein